MVQVILTQTLVATCYLLLATKSKMLFFDPQQYVISRATHPARPIMPPGVLCTIPRLHKPASLPVFRISWPGNSERT
jgi:hypothetical protein